MISIFKVSLLHLYFILVLASIWYIAVASAPTYYNHQEHIEKALNEKCDVTHWINNRREYQDRILASNDTIRNAKYVVAIPVKAGLADVILGYVAGFVWSLILDRPFIIQHVADLGDCEQRSIEYAYKPNKINWAYHLPYDTSMFNCMNVSNNHCGPYLNADNIVFPNDVTAVSKSSAFLSQINADTLHNPFHSSNMSTYHSDKDIIFYSGNRGITYKLFDSTSYHAQQFISMGLNKENIFPCLFNTLFKLKTDICINECKKTEQTIVNARMNNTITIGIHVRNPGGPTNDHFSCADSLTEYYKGAGKNVLLLFVTYDGNLQKRYKDIYGDTMILPYGIPTTVLGVHDRAKEKFANVDRKAQCDRVAAKDSEAVKASATDYHLMSLTDIQIVSHNSGFGLMSALTNIREKNIIYHMTPQAEGKERRKCSDNLDGDPLSAFAETWSGLRR